jgi:hypothetical protein
MYMKKVYYLLLILVISLAAACGSSTLDDNQPAVDDPDASAPSSPSGASSLMHQSNPLAPQILDAADHGGGFGWQKAKCFLCHTVTELKTAHDYSLSLSASFAKLGEAAIGACLYCHGSNGLNDVTPETYQCMLCHTDSTIVDSAGMFAGRHMHDMNGDGRINNADCLICHAFSDMNGAIDLAMDFRRGASDYANVSAFCLDCHDGNGAFGMIPPELSAGAEGTNIYSTYKGMGENSSAQKQTADIHGARNGSRTGSGAGAGSGHAFAELRGAYTGGIEVACLECHQVHSSDNPYLITQSGASAELADDMARAAIVAVTENDFSQLCAACHASPGGAPTDNGLTQVVHSGPYSAYCTDCHYHGAGFGANKSGLF